jgi:hypothetical protein
MRFGSIGRTVGIEERGLMARTDVPVADFPIVLGLVDGHLNITIAHLPAPCRQLVAGRGMSITWASFDAPPARWEAACGCVCGPVYNRGGVLEDVPVCAACEQAVVA